jgi:drug/metabolite transporter (DMT)-like permease
MKTAFRRRHNSMKLVGIIFIVLGVLALAYQGIRYTTQEKLIDIGPLKVTAKEKKIIPLPPIVGGVALVAGIALILADRRKK